MENLSLSDKIYQVGVDIPRRYHVESDASHGHVLFALKSLEIYIGSLGMSLWWPLLGLLSLSLTCHRNLFENRAHVDEIYGCPIFKWVTETWLYDRVYQDNDMVAGRHTLFTGLDPAYKCFNNPQKDVFVARADLDSPCPCSKFCK